MNELNSTQRVMKGQGNKNDTPIDTLFNQRRFITDEREDRVGK